MTLRNIRRKRAVKLVEWIIFYTLLIVTFMLFIYMQANDVNTLGFSSGQINLTTSKNKYTVGDSIAYTIKNNLSVPIVITSACPVEPLHIYKWSNGQWTRVHNTASATTCNSLPAQQSLAPGTSLTRTFDGWKNLFAQPGIYRVVALATNYTSLPYADFQVVSPPPAPIKVQAPPPQIIYQQVYTPIYVPVPSGGGTGGVGDGGGD